MSVPRATMHVGPPRRVAHRDGGGRECGSSSSGTRWLSGRGRALAAIAPRAAHLVGAAARGLLGRADPVPASTTRCRPGSKKSAPAHKSAPSRQASHAAPQHHAAPAEARRRARGSSRTCAVRWARGDRRRTPSGRRPCSDRRTRSAGGARSDRRTCSGRRTRSRGRTRSGRWTCGGRRTCSSGRTRSRGRAYRSRRAYAGRNQERFSEGWRHRARPVQRTDSFGGSQRHASASARRRLRLRSPGLCNAEPRF